MPFEERQELLPACKAYGLALIYLVAPTSSARAQAIAKESEGFVYCVSSMGVTGVRSQITTNIKEMVKAVKRGKDVPCAIGFGISTPEQARKMGADSDGGDCGKRHCKAGGQVWGGLRGACVQLCP